MGRDKNLILISIACVIVFIILMLLLAISFFSKNTNVENIPTPTPVNANSPEDASGGVRVITNPTIIEQNRQSRQITQLIHQTPHKGTNFSLYYDFKQDFFTLYLNPANQTAGNSEFDLFLKENGIGNRSWFNNLTVTSSPVTPAP